MAKLIGNEVFIDIASKEYPLSLAAIRRKNPHKMFGNAATTDLMRAFGYEVVQQVERPVGDVVTEETPIKTENGYIQVFSVRAYTQEETAERLAQAKRLFADKVDSMLKTALEKGVKFNFGEPNGELHIQLRDKDRLNIIGMRALANEGVGPQPFRTYENVNVVLTVEQVLAVAAAAHTGYLTLLGTAWNLKDQIASAPSEQHIPVLPDSL